MGRSIRGGLSWFALILVTPTVVAIGAEPRFVVEPVADAGVDGVHRILIVGPPKAPSDFHQPPAETATGEGDRAQTILTVPAYAWSFGASVTSASIIAAYYDRTSHPEIYTGPTNGGVMPMTNDTGYWPQWTDTNGDTYYQCPLSASHNGLDGRTTNGHVDDYWTAINQAGPDPYDGNWPEHTPADCTGDFMKSNRWYSSQGYNIDGGTSFYTYSDGTAMHAADMENLGLHTSDGAYGLKLFYQSRGYEVDTCYNQYVRGYNGNRQGFRWRDYTGEIDAGRPVMLHLSGHTMVGVGYNTTGRIMYVHDTWDFSQHSLAWRGTYYGMDHVGVTVVQPGQPTLVDLVRFEAKAGSGMVRLEWETASELDNAGFNVWRADTKIGPYKKFNKQLIPAEGGVSWGVVYHFDDPLVICGQTYFYKLEDVDYGGESMFHGPISVTVP